MNKQEHRMIDGFVFGMVAVLGAVLLAIGPGAAAQAQNGRHRGTGFRQIAGWHH